MLKMKRLAIGFFVFSLSTSAFGMGRKSPPSNSQDTGLVDTMTKAYEKRAQNGLLSGASIGVFGPQDLEVPLKLTFGEARSSRDRFEIGSISKSFTGILLSKLILEGKISLDAPIENIIPELKGSFAGSVSAHLLATHSARLVDDTSGEEIFREADLINYLKGYKPGLDRPAGERHYSNLGFMTLSLLISRTTGDSFVNGIKAQIFKPLQMTGSGYLNKKNVFRRILQPHTDLLEITSYDFLLDLADATGGIFSNLDDMSKFLRANLYPQTAPTLTEAILFSQKLGLGWDSDPGASVLWKNGAMTGFGSMIRLSPITHSGAVVLCNSRCTLSASALATIAMGGADQFKADLPLSDDLKSSVVGTYLDSTGKYAVDVLETSAGFLGLHFHKASVSSYYSLRLRRLGENKFSVYDGIGATSNDFVEFGIEAATGKKQVQYFEMTSTDSSGNPVFSETVFTGN